MSAFWAICSLPLALANVCQLEKSYDDPAEYVKGHGSEKKYITRDGGQPLDMEASLTASKHGPMLLQDYPFMETMMRFTRERIPERVVHAIGSGAFGYFEATHDITKYTKAKVFEVGRKTKMAVRFSAVTPSLGGSEITRATRGMALKFYTCEGIWDLVGNNTPLFFLRDPLLFIAFIHSDKRNPQTNMQDRSMLWDFFTLRPETIHQAMILFSERGIPDGYRHMHGFGVNTFKMVNKENTVVYVKFHYRTDQGIKNLSPERADNISGTDPNYFTRDLFNAIQRKEYPTWTFYIQVMTYEQAEKFCWNPFDPTKVWPHAEFPLIPVGKIVLNRNPTNYFAEVEQIALSPANLVPGIEPSPDQVLQARLFSYPDTQLYRLGPSHLQLPINSPHQDITNINRDGSQFYNQGAAPNYYPNSWAPYAALSAFNVTGNVKRYDKRDDDNFSQPAILWNKVLTEEQRNHMVENIAKSVKQAPNSIQIRTIKLCCNVSKDMGRKLAEKLEMKPPC